MRNVLPISPSPRPSVHLFSRWLKFAALGLLMLALAVAAFLYYVGLIGHPVREVIPGKIYRSGQLPAPKLERTLHDFGIRSVVNLRGERKNVDWYGSELEVCKAAGIEHANIKINLGVLPTPESLKDLIAKLESGPYPMLLHCRAGVDRSALAAVLVEMIINQKTLDEAMSAQMNWRNGHFEIGEAASIDKFFQLYRDTFGGHDIKRWISEDYPAIYAKQQNGSGGSDD